MPKQHGARHITNVIILHNTVKVTIYALASYVYANCSWWKTLVATSSSGKTFTITRLIQSVEKVCASPT